MKTPTGRGDTKQLNLGFDDEILGLESRHANKELQPTLRNFCRLKLVAYRTAKRWIYLKWLNSNSGLILMGGRWRVDLQKFDQNFHEQMMLMREQASAAPRPKPVRRRKRKPAAVTKRRPALRLIRK